MERNVSYATMVSTGEQPDITIHVAGFYEDDDISFHTKVYGTKSDIIYAIRDTVRNIGRVCKDDGEALTQFYLINVIHGIVEGVGAETFRKVFIDMMKGGDI